MDAMFFWGFLWLVMGVSARGVIHTIYPNLQTKNGKELAFEIIAWPYCVYVYFFGNWEKYREPMD